MTPELFDTLCADLRRRLKGYAFHYNSEAQLQQQLGEFFTNEGFPHVAEWRVSHSERPDFYLSDWCVAVEVKIQGSANAHLRQVRRYAEQPDIAGVILIAPRPVPDMPATLAGKPVAAIQLWRNLLG